MVGYIFGTISGMLITLAYCKRKEKNSKKMHISENERRIIGLVENSKDGFYYFETKPKWRYRYTYPPFEKTFGEEIGKLVYDQPELAFERVHPEDYNMLLKKIRGEINYNEPIIYRVAMGEIAKKEGRYTVFEEFTTPVYENGEVVAIQGILRDITEKLKLQKELEYRSTHDGLTKLFNREYFEGVLKKYNEEINAPVAIILCDLDELKYMNDMFGHKMGDLLIKETANLLGIYSSEDIFVSRIGGDEFTIMMINTNESRTEELIDNLNRDIDKYNDENKKIKIGISIGYAYTNQSINKMEKLLIEADRNMYADKNKKK